jgi:serine/threonine-protein kinase
MATSTQCDRERLKKLLAESLSDEQESDISAHLSACPDCRRELESLAAAENWWHEASQRLSRFTLDDSQHAAEDGYGLEGYGHDGYGHEDSAAHFATDFAVDFLEPSDDPQSLGRLADYEIQEVIGRGGMGVVLKGYQAELHRHVALKVLLPHLAASGAARRRFAREAQATAAVVHPHVMAIHSVEANVKLPYLVMPFVPCESLQERLNRQGPLDVSEILRIGMQSALGLAAAHAQGLVHRDVKPANILLETNVDRVLLTDFGLARAVDDATLTRTGVIAGTPQYMSPEQANGDPVDRQSDLFSLGGVLYAMCTGRPPFRAETTFGVLRRIRETAPRAIREINPDVPVWLERIVLKLLAKDARERFDSAEDVAKLLEHCLAHVQQPTAVPLPDRWGDWPLRPAPPISPAAPNRRLRVRRAIVASTVIVSALIAGWAAFGPRNGKQRDDAALTNSVDPETTSLEWNATQSELDEIQTEIDWLDAAMSDDDIPSEPSAATETPPAKENP